MSTVPKRMLTPQEYLAQERLADFRSEYYRGETFAMAGASRWHTRIKDNLGHKAASQLEGGPCEVFTSDLRVKVSATGLYTYPDVIIVCGEQQYEEKVLDTLLNPRALVDVLSDSTENYDRGDKFELYKQLASLQEYVLVAQDRPYLERHVRQPDGTWAKSEFDDIGQAFSFASIAVQIPLAEIYRGVEFPGQ